MEKKNVNRRSRCQPYFCVFFFGCSVMRKPKLAFNFELNLVCPFPFCIKLTCEISRFDCGNLDRGVMDDGSDRALAGGSAMVGGVDFSADVAREHSRFIFEQDMNSRGLRLPKLPWETGVMGVA